MSRLMRFPSAIKRDQAIDAWMHAHADELGEIAQRWFEVMRNCGDDAAFAYANAFKAHVNVGFFCGVGLADPDGLLEGTGKFMRHVKLRPGQQVNDAALRKLIYTAYVDMKRRLTTD
jgi:hypothetical protein